MSVFKCKMCGGALEVEANQTTAVCEYCGTNQTLPRLDDEQKVNLYDRANHFRRNNEFDKAESIYEQILNADNTDSESYWSLVLCKYGIEYVEDPASKRRVPTVNRAQFTSVYDDDNYKSAIKNADISQKIIYEAEAAAINEIQKGILEISQKEEPFDVFICYKETDANGRRTQDSVLATELYHELTRENYKVFFSRITLEDKLGTAYEPYIFAALNSAKVMVVLGTRPEHFNAVWVKNEWSRYLSLVRTSGGKKVLIPAYRDMDPYDLPQEFSHLQAQDMAKLGFMQDLTRGISKIIDAASPKSAAPAVTETVVVESKSTNIAPLLKRAYMFLEDGDWQSADEYCEKVLDIEPECAEAYLGKLMVECKCRNRADLGKGFAPLENCSNYSKVIRFADEALADEFKQYAASVIINIKQRAYDEALELMQNANTKEAFENATEKFKSISGFKDADQMAEQCIYNSKKYMLEYATKLMKTAASDNVCQKAKNIFVELGDFEDAAEKAKECEIVGKNLRDAKTYAEAMLLYNSDKPSDLRDAMTEFGKISDYKDAAELEKKSYEKLEAIRAAEKASREEFELKKAETEAERQRVAKICKRFVWILVSVIMAVCVFLIVLDKVIIPNAKYNAAEKLAESGDYYGSYLAFLDMGDYKDSKKQADSKKPFIVENQYSQIDDLSVGAVINLGMYEQDGDTTNGEEAIEWQVLEVEDGKALVISKHILDLKAFCVDTDGPIWSTSSMRSWLNGSFYEDACLDYAGKNIAVTKVNSENRNSSTVTTEDILFLLSEEETLKYFADSTARQAQFTAVVTSSSTDTLGKDSWLLRTNGKGLRYLKYIGKSGAIKDGRYYSLESGVRPAMWINLNQD